MAEGRESESLRNNLCQNQEEKVVEEKKVNEKSGFPELALAETMNSNPHGMVNGHPLPAVPPVHHHSRQSETELKDMLEEAPSLTRTVSEVSVSQGTGQMSRSDSSAKISNVDPAPLAPEAAGGVQSSPAGADKPCLPERLDDGCETDCSNIVSSYLRAAVAGDSSRETSAFSSPSTTSPFSPLPSQEAPRDLPNNLNGPQGGPPPSTFPPMMGPGSMMGGVMPLLCYPMFPMSYDPSGQMSVLSAMYGSQPCYPNSSLMPNIAYGHQGTSRAGPERNGGPAQATMMGGYCSSSQPTLDSRNIPVKDAGNGTALSSEENSSGGSRSYSINPGNDTRLTRLRDPVLQWIRKKLDRRCVNNWEAVADSHGWNYEDILDHLADCRHSGESPFLQLLQTETFCTYTVREFLNDMQSIGRKDILMDFSDVLQKNGP